MSIVATTTNRRSSLLSYFSLFTSLSTLLCCALPSLLVLFGLGALVASADYDSFPTTYVEYSATVEGKIAAS